MHRRLLPTFRQVFLLLVRDNVHTSGRVLSFQAMTILVVVPAPKTVRKLPVQELLHLNRLNVKHSVIGHRHVELPLFLVIRVR